MTIKKHTLLLSALLATVALVACGDDDSGMTEAPKGPDMNVAAMEDLPNCTEKREGETAFVAEDNSTYECKGGKWIFVPAPTPTVETLDDLLNCTAKADGDSVIVEAEKAMFRCSDGEWKKLRAFTDTLASFDDLLACVAKREGNSTYITEEHALYHCEDGSWGKVAAFMDTVKTKDDFSNCTDKKEDDSTFVSKENAVYLCIEKIWRYLGSVTEISEDLPNCTEKRNGNRVFVADEHVTLICSEGKWYRYDIYKFIDEDDVPEVSSSSEDWDDFEASSSSLDNSSSSAKSSSSATPQSSSSATIVSSSSAKSSSSSVAQSSSSDPKYTEGTLTDSRDGKIYRTVTIGTQTWMAENLNYGMDSSFCYNNLDSNCSKYGRLYDWNSAMTACPKGWHLPSKNEWNTLFSAVGGESMAGKALKSAFGWYSSGTGTDTFGFSALPAGYRLDYRDDGEGYNADFWSSTEHDNDSDFAYCMVLYYYSDYGYQQNLHKDAGRLSVRCLQD